MQTGFGAFATVYLVKNLWPPHAIGFALTVATISTLVSQIPAGAVLDSKRDKRQPVLLGIAGVGLAALLLCLTAARPRSLSRPCGAGAGEFVDRTRHRSDQPGVGRKGCSAGSSRVYERDDTGSDVQKADGSPEQEFAPDLS